MKKIPFLIMVLALLSFSLAYADMNDTATLGGQDSSGQYYWRVNGGNLIPGTTNQNSIGDSSHAITSLTATGNLTFKSSLQTTGIGTSGATVCTTVSTALSPKTYSIVYATISTRTLTIADGYAGQILTIVAQNWSDTGTLTVTATTKTSWTTAAMDTHGDTLTLLYVDDTYGWIVLGASSVTITQT
jgi:hypothetical protein